jgi:hypothetical protein
MVLGSRPECTRIEVTRPSSGRSDHGQRRPEVRAAGVAAQRRARVQGLRKRNENVAPIGRVLSSGSDCRGGERIWVRTVRGGRWLVMGRRSWFGRDQGEPVPAGVGPPHPRHRGLRGRGLRLLAAESPAGGVWGPPHLHGPFASVGPGGSGGVGQTSEVGGGSGRRWPGGRRALIRGAAGWVEVGSDRRWPGEDWGRARLGRRGGHHGGPGSRDGPGSGGCQTPGGLLSGGCETPGGPLSGGCETPGGPLSGGCQTPGGGRCLTLTRGPGEVRPSHSSVQRHLDHGYAAAGEAGEGDGARDGDDAVHRRGVGRRHVGSGHGTVG